MRLLFWNALFLLAVIALLGTTVWEVFHAHWAHAAAFGILWFITARVYGALPDK